MRERIGSGHYVINTSSGRKLVRVHEGSGSVWRIQKLRAATKRWTLPEWVAEAWLYDMGIRLARPVTDGDLLRTAKAADRSEGGE